MNFEFLKSNAVRLLTLVLVLQGVVLLSYSRPESTPPSMPLAGFPVQIGDWSRRADGVMEKEVADVLQADDLLNRDYINTKSANVNLFVAAFRSQRNGKAPHSPKNCLPGSGWVQQTASIETIPVGDGKTIEANRYVIAKGESRSLVYYWYQSRDRSVANEYKAKYYVVEDAIRYNRTDTALVRVVMGLRSTEQAAEADIVCRDFIAKMYPNLREYLPQ
jgi:EpsI family protein